MERMRFGSVLARSISSESFRLNNKRPPVISPPPNSTRRINESEETDFPEPDSPTRQTVSPDLILKDTSETPTTGPSFV